jgi:hypothetical protein
LSIRVGLAAAAALALAVLPAPQAAAHEGNPNFSSEITRIAPPADGLEVEVVNFDDSLRLENDTGETVVVEGYDGEPYVRITGDGAVSVNRRSPSYYLNEDRFARVEVPASADPEAPPQWEQVDGSGQFSWHDHRIHYMAEGTPPQVDDPDARTKVFDYAVRLEVDGRPTRLLGTLTWVGDAGGGFPVAPFAGLGALALGALVAVVLLRRRGAPAADADRATGEAW